MTTFKTGMPVLILSTGREHSHSLLIASLAHAGAFYGVGISVATAHLSPRDYMLPVPPIVYLEKDLVPFTKPAIGVPSFQVNTFDLTKTIPNIPSRKTPAFLSQKTIIFDQKEPLKIVTIKNKFPCVPK